MKKSNFINKCIHSINRGGVLIFSIALLLGIVSCDNPIDDDFDYTITNTIDNTEIFGTWVHTQNIGGQITFNEDGTSSFKQDKDSNQTYTGEYSLSDSTLSIKFEWTMESTGVTSSYNEKYSATISDDKLTLKFKSGRWEVSTSKGKQKSSTTDCLIAKVWQNTTGKITLEKAIEDSSEDEDNTPNGDSGDNAGGLSGGNDTNGSSNDSSSAGDSSNSSGNTGDSSNSDNNADNTSNDNNSASDSSNSDSNTGDSSVNGGSTGDSSNSGDNADNSSSGNDTNDSSDNNDSSSDSSNNDDNNGNDEPVYNIVVTIPSDVTEITQDYFQKLCTDLGTSYNSVEKVIISETITSIGKAAFYWCQSLKSISISNSVTSIGDYAFMDCTSLTSITVDNENEYYSSDDGVLFDKNKTTLILYPAGKYNYTYSIPNSAGLTHEKNTATPCLKIEK